MSATPAPTFTEPNLVGVHNSDLTASTLRILQGGSWKKQNVVMLLPAAAMVPMKCAISWMHLMSPPNQAFHKVPILGMEVGDAYSTAIEGVLAHPVLKECQYLLTIEHDNTVPPDGLLKLLADMEAHPEFSGIGGLYWTKGPAGVPQIWGDPRDPVMNFRPQPPDPAGGLVECNGTGMGFNLWRMSMLRDPRFPKPIFKTKCSPQEGVGTQDLAFATEARKLGYRFAIDCSILCGHFDHSTDTCW